ncbi:MAG TPA: polysaccharide biosynthesis protein [Clostridia bacterium]|nr:polysaccharide biosynthesis protein [Clostridia bacterium]
MSSGPKWTYRAVVGSIGLLICDAFILNLSVFLALYIRFDWRFEAVLDLAARYRQVAVPYTLVGLLAFYLSGLYRNLWEYASVGELIIVMRSVLSATAVFAFFFYRFLWPGFPRSVMILSGLVLLLLLGAFRMRSRLMKHIRQSGAANGVYAYESRRHGKHGRGSEVGPKQPKRALLVGAGDAGEMVVKEMRNNPEIGYRPVGFIDDDPKKHGMRIHGVPVLGPMESIPGVVADRSVDEIIFAMPSAGRIALRRLMKVMEEGHVRIPVKTLPGIYELIEGRVSVNQIREVRIEDLLGREPVSLDLEEIADYLRGKRVLVTGAGGSIGSELCRQIARFDPELLVLLDHAENPIFELSQELSYRFPNLEFVQAIADIRDRARIAEIFSRFKPAVVFHAAAHKHVPLMEENPEEAVKTNVFGTRNVLQACSQFDVERFVLISTDKAVRPTSIMGATKRIAEILTLSMNGCAGEFAVGDLVSVNADDGSAQPRRQLPDKVGPDFRRTRYMAVRFGNVIGSRGSVVPLFKEQIARGGPVTVTHPDMRRYFMTISEASQLVIQAAAIGKGGELFVLDMGEPVRILDLARQMIELSGLEPEKDIAIEFIGPRPGEKLLEEIFTPAEDMIATRHSRIMMVRNPLPDRQKVTQGLAALEAAFSEAAASSVTELEPNVKRGNSRDNSVLIRSVLKEIVPDYQRPDY